MNIYSNDIIELARRWIGNYYNLLSPFIPHSVVESEIGDPIHKGSVIVGCPITVDIQCRSIDSVILKIKPKCFCRWAPGTVPKLTDGRIDVGGKKHLEVIGLEISGIILIQEIELIRKLRICSKYSQIVGNDVKSTKNIVSSLNHEFVCFVLFAFGQEIIGEKDGNQREDNDYNQHFYQSKSIPSHDSPPGDMSCKIS